METRGMIFTELKELTLPAVEKAVRKETVLYEGLESKDTSNII